jgi:hypothetical protein
MVIVPTVSCAPEFPLFLDQPVAYQVADGLGPVGVPFPGDETVELSYQIAVDGHAETGNARHKASVLRIYKKVTQPRFPVKAFPPVKDL